MDIVKKNLLSIICGVVALSALVFLLYPLGSWYDQLRDDLKKPELKFSTINNLRRSPRSWPVITDLSSGSKPALIAIDSNGQEHPVFPSDSYRTAGSAIKAKVQAQADEMKKELHDFTPEERKDPSRTNKLTLLVEGVLPVPQTLGFSFQKEYVNQVRTVLPMELSGKYPMPPTKEDVTAEADRLWNTKFKNKVYEIGGAKVNFKEVEADWQKECALLEGTLRLKRAEDTSSKLYLEPTALSISGAMIKGDGVAPQPKDIWYAQLMLWVQQDVAAAIERTNMPARNVMEAPIKHLYKLTVPEGQGAFIRAGAATAGPGGGGGDPALAEAGKVFTRTPTGRVCNSMYDVIQFGLLMDVEASKVPVILAELQRGKLITILQTDMASVDSIALEDEGFIYGDVPVVRLTIVGEEMFLHNWTRDFIPADVK